MKPHATQARLGSALRPWAVAALAVALIGPLAQIAHAQVTVDTLGGGPTDWNLSPSGNADGNTYYESQFNAPVALAMDSEGSLYLADKNNGKIRKVTKPGDNATSQTLTLVAGLNAPVGVTVDRGDFIYVLTQGDGRIRRYDFWGNYRYTIATNLAGATAMAMDGNTNFYVTIPGTGGAPGLVKRVSLAGVVATLTNTFNQPQGIAMMGNGLLAVSDTGSNAVRFINPFSGTNVLVVGGHGAGFADGPAEYAKFDSPAGLASSPSGNLVVADRMNHRVRMVMTNGLTTTLYGVDPSRWGPSDPPQFYAGWWDGSSIVAEARQPVSAVVSPAGTLYTTELSYHLLRAITGAPLGAGGSTGSTNGGGTNVVITPTPWISVVSGYYPMGQSVVVASSYPVYYTTDGTTPTTSSRQVALTNGNTGIIEWNEPLRDLTSLRLLAADGSNVSAVVSGMRPAVNELGVTRDIIAGSGSTVLVPLVLNLQSNTMVKTIQYRVEVTPQGNAPAVRPEFGAVSISSNDFIQLAGASVPGAVAFYEVLPYGIPNPTNTAEVVPGGLAIFVIGTNANFYVDRFGTVAMLRVPVHPSALEGDTYTISLYDISGTSDGEDTDVPIVTMPTRTITIQNIPYLVGDSASSQWYAAGYFGDADLRNNDVNNAFYSSLGIRAPFSYTDVFDAMDVYPEDDPAHSIVGGDGQIRYLDWQHLLRRSLRLDTNNYERAWTNGGYRVCQASYIGRTAGMRVRSFSAPGPGDVWARQVKLSSRVLTNAVPGFTYSFPVYVDVAAGCSLAGLSFRALVVGEGDAPGILDITVSAAPGKPMPMVLNGLAVNEKLCAWSLSGSTFSPPLQGSNNLVAYLNVRVPVTASAGHCYTLRFPVVDGAANLTTQYEFESLSGRLWVRSAALLPPDIISEQWKTHFFGFAESPRAAADWDDDGDGVINLDEYLAGTDPTNQESCLQVLSTRWTTLPAQGLAVSWLSATGKKYAVDRAPQLGGPWTPVASSLLGDGQVRTWIDSAASGQTQFYRVRLQP